MQESFFDTSKDIQTSLKEIGADSSILKAAIKLKYKNPTLVQSKLFELSQDKNHIVIKSKTRSGKSSGFLLLALHKLIQKINKSKKKPHFIAIVCPNKAVCNANEALLEKILSFAQEEYEISHLNLTKTTHEIFENEMFLEAKKRLILIGTPASFKKMLLSLPNPDYFHQSIETIFLDELNFMFSFGYEADLNQFLSFYKERSEQINIYFSLSNEDERVKDLKSSIMKNSVAIKFNEQPTGDEEEGGAGAILLNEFFYISDEITRYICLYVLFKLKLVGGRTLIICKDIDEMYKVNAFLERCQVKTSKVYSPQWPAKVRQYFLTVFNTNLTNVLVSTIDIFDVGRQTANNKGGLREVDNIITMDLSLIVDIYDRITEFLNDKKSIPCLIEFLDPSDESKELLFELLEQAKSRTKGSGISPLPVKPEQVKTFNYRCTDIYKSITQKQINILKTMDIKKQLVKSKELKEYFDDHQKERELVIKDIEKLAQKVARHSVKMEENVPSYLLEEAKQEIVAEEKPKKGKIIKLKYNEEYHSSLAKRMAANNLSMDDVKKKRKMEGDKYLVINDELEDPTITDSTRLIPLSNRKLWKMRHRKPLKRINKRLQKKGIFQS